MCFEVNGKQIQLLYLKINIHKYAAGNLLLNRSDTCLYCDIWEFELSPEDKFTAYRLQTQTVQRLTFPLKRVLSCLTVPIICRLAFFE